MRIKCKVGPANRSFYNVEKDLKETPPIKVKKQKQNTPLRVDTRSSYNTKPEDGGIHFESDLKKKKS